METGCWTYGDRVEIKVWIAWAVRRQSRCKPSAGSGRPPLHAPDLLIGRSGTSSRTICCSRTMRSRAAPLVRVPRTLPRVLAPAEADRLVGALRTHRDRAIVAAMLLAGLRRCEVLGLRLEHVQVAGR